MDSLFAQGIIIGSGENIRTKFRDSTDTQITDFALDLAKSYNKVILHLGQAHSFERGGLFFYKTSKRNLVTFSKVLKERQVNLELWMMDSFGAAAFEKIHTLHQTIILGNLEFLNNLGVDYESIIVDLEWINLPKGDNGVKFQNILMLLKEKTVNKTIKAFVPLVDDEAENRARGYDQDALQNMGIELIPMLYIIDGGFYEKNNTLLPYLDDKRVRQLKRYYSQKGYVAAISLESGFIIKKEGKHFFVKTVQHDKHSVFENLEVTNNIDSQYFQMIGLKANRPFQLEKNDLTPEQIRKNQEIFWIKIKPTIIDEDSYVWRYYLLN